MTATQLNLYPIKAASCRSSYWHNLIEQNERDIAIMSDNAIVVSLIVPKLRAFDVVAGEATGNSQALPSRRMSLLTILPPAKEEHLSHGTVDAALVAVESQQDVMRLSPVHGRRSSLDVNLEYAIAMVNEVPSMDTDDGFMCPFGTRRDSVCGQRTNKNEDPTQQPRSLKRNLKTKQNLTNEESL